MWYEGSKKHNWDVTGSFTGTWSASDYQAAKCAATIDFKLRDTLSATSGARIPGTNMSLLGANPFGKDGPMRDVVVTWTWKQRVYFLVPKWLDIGE